MSELPGLTSDEAARRLASSGPNRLVPETKLGWIRRAAGMLADPMAILLAATGTLYAVLGERVDATVAFVALIPVLGVDVLLESRSRRALEALRASLAPTARVIRDGREQDVPTEQLVEGDALVLREGDFVHADARVLHSEHLEADEARLTGESEPQRKGAGTTMLAGSQVLTGTGTAVVTATGTRTEYGALAAQVAETSSQKTPLQHRVAGLVKRLGVVAFGVAVLLFVARLASGASTTDAFLSSISLAMAAAPEEFPLVFTLFLAIGAVRLARRGILVRRLAAVEALGSTTAICTDKTGTLTLGRFRLDHHLALAGDDDRLLEIAALACEPSPADAMEQAILAHAAEHAIDIGRLHETWALIADHPFDPEGKHMTHVWQRGERWRVVMKGALEGVLAHCAPDPAVRAEAERAMARLGHEGMRVLGVAMREGTGAPPADRADAEHDLALVGLIGFRDPLRPEVPDAVRSCREAGIGVKVVTGDHVWTARTIAEAAGLDVTAEHTVTGPELAALSPDARARRVESATVLARIRPHQKHEIVDILDDAGEVVAMTGDGVNDAPALRRAAIGVSMGRGATEVARAAAGVVLLGSDFGALVDAVREGRTIYRNLQRAFLFLIAFHIPIVALAVAAPVLGLPLILLPIHMVWLELVVHPVSALAFEGAPADDDAMRVPPRRPSEPLLPRYLVGRALLSGGLLAAGSLGLFVAYLPAGTDAARAAALIAILAGGLALVWAEQALNRPWWRVPLPRAPRFWIVLGLVALSIPLALWLPPAASMLSLAVPPGRAVALALAVAVVSVLWRVTGTKAARASRTRQSAARREHPETRPPAPAVGPGNSRYDAPA